MFSLLWIAALLLGLFIPWATNVPRKGTAVVVYSLMIVNVLIHFMTQSLLFERPVGMGSSVQAREAAETTKHRLEAYLDTFALTPSKLTGWRLGQLLTANFIHAGWIHLALNLWMFFLYGRNLEDLFGRKAFCIFLFLAAIGSQTVAYLLSSGTANYNGRLIGFSGVVYAVIGAYLICFPRSRIRGLVVYDLRFWAGVFLIVFPLAFLLSYLVPPIAEIVFIAGLFALFLIMQPDHFRFSLPAWIHMAAKLVFDFLTVSPVSTAAIRVSMWAHFGGLLLGAIAGLARNGSKGFSMTWDDNDQRFLARKTKAPGKAKALKQLEIAAQNSREAAKMFLGQRIFVGDAETATKFFVNVVQPKFPDLPLEPREAYNLARMLEKRDLNAPALSLYHRLCVPGPPVAGLEEVPLRAATLASKMGPEQTVDALRYLHYFDQCAQTMRDKHEARRLREEIIHAATVLGHDAKALMETASIPFEKSEYALPQAAAANNDTGSAIEERNPPASGYGGSAQPERRRTQRIQSRMLRLAPTDEEQPDVSQDTGAPSPESPDSPAEANPSVAHDTSSEDATPQPDSGQELGGIPNQDFIEQWGKRPLPVHAPGKKVKGREPVDPDENLQMPKSQPRHIPGKSSEIQPPIQQQESKTGRRRGSFVDLTGLTPNDNAPTEPQQGNETGEQNPSPAKEEP